MSDMWSAVIGGIIGLMGVFVGSWLAARFSVQQQQRQNRVQALLNLYSEFQSESMLESRIKAGAAFDSNISDLPLGFSNLRQKIGDSNWFHVSKVVHFFEKYAVYYNSNCLDTNLTKVTLDRYFIYWYNNHSLKLLVKSSLERDFDEWGAWAKSVKQLADKLRA
ncbi:MAG: hypothetical protein HC781_15330 [Leptolyngbyaceae cyanobacterium CSU_1_4]|nr:hypothetical protein [Leptolyngbyaceae cyanobacterium CSU_1_4]